MKKFSYISYSGVFLCLLLISIESAQAAIELPIEVLGAGGTVKTNSLSLPAGATATQLSLQVHDLDFQQEASVRINGGSWRPLRNDNSTISVHTSDMAFGGIAGAHHTVRLTLAVPTGTFLNGNNTISFRFNRDDGKTIGYRVIKLAVLDANNANLVPSSELSNADPATWTAPRPTEVSAGEDLWHNAPLLASPLAGAVTLQARCSDCHANDGRDLKYFNYSNNSIIERAKFHGLSQEDGEKIASYIRSLAAPAPPQARPWNPPYQPGPGLDSRPASRWAAGAGIDAVLDNNEAAHAADPTIHSDASRLIERGRMKPINLREQPITMQLPDWNRWLPQVHPLDTEHGAMFATDTYNTDYLRIQNGLTGRLGITARQYIDLDLREDLDLWAKNVSASFNGPGPGTRSPFILAFIPEERHLISTQAKHEVYGAFLWSLVKLWGLMQEFSLETQAVSYHGVNAEARSWLANRHVFNMSPNLVFSIFAAKTPPLHGDINSSMVHIHLSNAWYQLQLLLNPGARGLWQGGFDTVDWAYQAGVMDELGELTFTTPQQYDGYRYAGFIYKSMEMADNGLSPRGFNVGGPDVTYNSWWGPDLREDTPWATASVNRILRNIPEPTRRRILRSIGEVWMEKSARFTPYEWAGLHNRVVGNTYNEPLSDYVLTSFPDLPPQWWDIPEGGHAYHILNYVTTLTRQTYPLDEAVPNSYARLGKLLWPANDWLALQKITNTAPPSQLTVSANLETAQLSWQPVPGARSYNIKRTTTPSGIPLTIELFHESTSYTDRDLVGGRTYYYTVSANMPGATNNAPMQETADSKTASAQAGLGLVAQHLFDESTGDTFASNKPEIPALQLVSAASNLAATVRQGIPGPHGSALDLAGRAYLSTRYNLARWYSGTFTLSSWVRTQASGEQVLLNAPALTGSLLQPNRNGAPITRTVVLGALDLSGRLGVRLNSTGNLELRTNKTINDGQWHHVAITRNADTGLVSIYLDGALDNSATLESGNLFQRSFSVGRPEHGSTSQIWPGALDDFRIYNHVLSGTEIAAIHSAASNVPVALGKGIGLVASYYSGPDFATLRTRRIDPQVNFDWRDLAPASVALTSANNFNVRWTGSLVAPRTGIYKFTVRSNDGCRLYVNNQNIINFWQPQATTERTGEIQLTAGQRYPLQLDYREDTGRALVQLSWAYPGQSSQIIPSEFLYPFANLVKISGTVIGTRGSFDNNGFVRERAFDGNTATYFDGPNEQNGNYGWVGLDLGEPRVISTLRAYPAAGRQSRLLGGKWQASSSANFSSDVVDLASITSPVAAATWVELISQDPTPRRYVRYYGAPSSYVNLAEGEVWGPAKSTGTIDSYSDWRNLHLSADTSPTDDADGDGVDNLLEYVLGLNPRVRETDYVPTTSTITIGSNDYLSMRYTRNRYVNDYRVIPLISENLRDWSRSGIVQFSLIVHGSDQETITVRSAMPMSSMSRQFLRLIAEPAP